MATKETTHQNCSEQLMQLVPVLARLIRRGIRQVDPLMSPAHMRILDCLSRCPGVSLSELSCELDITNATASSHIDKLVKRRLVERVENPLERRRVALTLTAEGRRSLEMMKAASTTVISEMLASLPSAKLHRVHDGLQVLDDACKQFNESHNKTVHPEVL